MPERPRQSRSRMPPPAFLPSLASELKRNSPKLKKNSGEDSSSAESLSSTRNKSAKPNCSFAEKAKGVNDAGYCSANTAADQESQCSSELNNNDSSNKTTPQAKRKTKPKAKVEPMATTATKKKNKRGFEISFAFEAATKDKEEAKQPPNVANSNASVEERPPTPVSSVPEAWDEGIETPSMSDDEGSHYSIRTSAFASTSSLLGCLACKQPFVPYSDPIWVYKAPHLATCRHRSFDESEEYTEDLEVIAQFNRQRILNLQRRLLLRKEMEKYITSEPWGCGPWD